MLSKNGEFNSSVVYHLIIVLTIWVLQKEKNKKWQKALILLIASGRLARVVFNLAKSLIWLMQWNGANFAFSWSTLWEGQNGSVLLTVNSHFYELNYDIIASYVSCSHDSILRCKNPNEIGKTKKCKREKIPIYFFFFFYQIYLEDLTRRIL